MNINSSPVDFSKTFKVSFSKESGCNTTQEVIDAHVRENIRRGLPQVYPYVQNENIALLVCGGPSLAIPEVITELRDEAWRGGRIVTVNGAYNWCIERNLRPSAAIMLDAREFNGRFIEQEVIGCKYFLASQCHPKTFELCRGRETYIWHACSGGDSEYDILKEYYFDRTYPISLGTTVGIRAISLLRMLGFNMIDIFGLDSCWLNDQHHAYDQPENTTEKQVTVWLRPGKGQEHRAMEFKCSPWHMKQMEDFLEVIRERGHLFRLSVRGPGLLAEIMRTSADIQIEIDSAPKDDAPCGPILEPSMNLNL